MIFVINMMNYDSIDLLKPPLVFNHSIHSIIQIIVQDPTHIFHILYLPDKKVWFLRKNIYIFLKNIRYHPAHWRSMKRRDFITATAAAGISTMVPGSRLFGAASQPDFELHPFIKSHPGAVFIHLTNVESKSDVQGIRDAGYNLARELVMPVASSANENTPKIVIKPNWTSAQPKRGKPVFEKLGVNTDPNFIEGWVQGAREAGYKDFFITEAAAQQWDDMGYRAMAERNGIIMRDLSTKPLWEMEEGRDFNVVQIPGGVVLKKLAYMAPTNGPGTALIDIAKMKAHGMGITGCVKNLQGSSPGRLRNFCMRHDQVRKSLDPRLVEFFRDGFEEQIESLYAQHLKAGIPRWDKPGQNGGLWMEMWCQRMLDSLSVTPTALNIMEGIYSQDGNGFGLGPHEKSGPFGVTSRDYMSNVVLFGLNPILVDIITFWLAGHEPGNFGLFHLAIERGMSNVLDPHDIPVYIWKNNQAELIQLDDLKRTPLVTYYMRRDYNGQNEANYHLCDEPFDYSAWKAGKPVGECTPSSEELRNHMAQSSPSATAQSLPEAGFVDVVDRKGDIIWRLRADCKDTGEPVPRQVVWDGFDQPGMYSHYVKGMKWDEERKEITFV